MNSVKNDIEELLRIAERLRGTLIEPEPKPEPVDYSDIRPGDLVEFDFYGKHYGPTLCYCDLGDSWYIRNETDSPIWFLHADGTPFDDCRNIVIHREKRMKETVVKGTCTVLPCKTVGETAYSDIRPGDIVEFDRSGTHCGPTECFEDEDGDWYIKDENGNERWWFICDAGIPFYDDIENIVIHRELRTGEPEDQGLYITQSRKIVVKDNSDERTNWNYLDEDDDEMLYCSWDVLIKKLDESEFPLRKAKAVAE